MPRIVAAFVVSLLAGLAIAPAIIFLLKKIKARQSILVYVTQHKDKQGVPTMGGIIFLIATSIGFFLFTKGQRTLSVVSYVVFLTYGSVGLIDDGIKAIFKRNLGLKAYQKVISQAVIAALVTYYCYTNEYVGGAVYLPFSGRYAHLSWWYLPVCFTAFIATTNAVNLTDGLDGLAGSVSAVYLAFIGVFIFTLQREKADLGQTVYAQELFNLLILCVSCMGAIVSFLWFNTSRASVFMGDTGSLALGGLACVLPVMIKNLFLIAFVGIIFVVSVISVIVQVLSFKIRKRRVFLMAPVHHHLEMKGYTESKIMSFYVIITIIFGSLAILFW